MLWGVENVAELCIFFDRMTNQFPWGSVQSQNPGDRARGQLFHLFSNSTGFLVWHVGVCALLNARHQVPRFWLWIRIVRCPPFHASHFPNMQGANTSQKGCLRKGMREVKGSRQKYLIFSFAMKNRSIHAYPFPQKNIPDRSSVPRLPPPRNLPTESSPPAFSLALTSSGFLLSPPVQGWLGGLKTRLGGTTPHLEGMWVGGPSLPP